MSQYIANWLISRKIGEGRPWVFTGLILLAAYVLSAFVSLYATIVIIWSIFYKICDSIGVQRKSSYCALVISGVVIVSSLTGTLFPFKVFSQVVYGLVLDSTGLELTMDFMPWFIYNFVISVVLTVAYLLAARFIIRPDVSLVKEAGAKYAELRHVKMNGDQKVAAVVLVLFVISQLIPSFLSQSNAVVAQLNNLSVTGCIVVCMIALAIIYTKENKPIANIGKLISKGTSWDIVILMAATTGPLSAALQSEDTGILNSIVAWITTTFSGLSAIAFLLVIVIIFLAVTQVSNNMILMVVFIPMLAKIGLNYGIHPFVVANLIYFTAQSAFLIPASSSQAAMIYGNTEWVSTSHAFKYNVTYIILALIVLTVIGIPLAQFLFR